MTTHLTAAPVYGLTCPSVADLRACLTHASEGDTQLWSRVCQAADIPADADDPPALSALLTAALEITTGPVRVAVMSLHVRVRAHTTLTALGEGTQPGVG